MRIFGVVFGFLVVGLMVAITLGLAALFYLELHPESKCAVKVRLSDRDLIQLAWNAGLPTLPRLATDHDVSQMLASDPGCCRVVRVGDQSLWDKVKARDIFAEAPGAIVQLSVEDRVAATKSTARVEIDACGNVSDVLN